MQGKNNSNDGKDGSVYFFDNKCRATTKEIEIVEGQPLGTEEQQLKNK